MNQFSSFYKNGLEALKNGTFQDFEQSFIQPTDVREKRILGHLRVKKLMSEGQYELAVKELNSTREFYGEHISLISDQACLYYALEDYWHWDGAVAHLEKTYSEIHSVLDEESRFKTGLLLAKFFEEQGLFKKSIAFLKALKKTTSSNQYLHQARILANLVRLHATSGNNDELMIFYKDLKYLVESNLEFKTDTEIIYALIFCEARFFETTHNNAIWKNSYKKYLLDNRTLLQEEKSQILFDLIQLKMSGVNIDMSEYESEVHYLTPHTEYERKLLNIYNNNLSEISEWTLWSSQMPIGNFLLLGALLLSKLSPSEQELLEKQILMLTFSFEKDDREYWAAKFTKLHTDKILVAVDPSQSVVKLKSLKLRTDSVINLSSKKSLFNLINVVEFDLRTCRQIPFEKLTKNLFKSEMDESYFHRIREQVRRINQEFKILNLLPIFIIRDGHLCITEGYSFTVDK